MTFTEQLIVSAVPALIPCIATWISNRNMKRSQKKHAEETASKIDATDQKIDILHEQMNGTQTKLLEAVTDAATQRGASEERTRQEDRIG